LRKREFSVLDRQVLTSGKKTNTSKDGVVIHRLIREVGDETSYPALTKTNYSDWPLLMNVKLKARVWWSQW
jgi:hypothetical protein